ncbi:MAG: sulfite exporter TauE/SafE family protein [Candidatus Dormibacteraceae bacterium]
MSALLPYVGLVAVGVLVGAYGTLIGAGGGFVLVPLLLLLYPHKSPAQLTAVSLAVVLANASSGSLSYYRLRRADYKSGAWLAVATIPGAILGAIVVGTIPRGLFEVIMGVTLLVAGGFLALRPKGRFPLLSNARFSVARTLMDSEGTIHRYRFNLGLAMAISVLVGFFSSLLGIGGGIIHVPVLATFFAFPEHIATATSHFVLIFTSGAGTATHLFKSDYAGTFGLTVSLAAGVLIGAPFGAALSRRVTGTWIIRLLAIALGFVGLRLLATA